jgi:hypothetical protein
VTEQLARGEADQPHDYSQASMLSPIEPITGCMPAV